METKSFNGLHNVSDGIRLGIGWLATADNINITDTGAIVKREGYAAVSSGAYTGIYSTIDHQRCYVVDGGSLKTFDGATLKTGLSDATVYWTELNGQVFYSNGTDSGIINPDNEVLTWRWDVPVTPVATAVTGALDPGMYQVICTTTLPDGRETGPTDPVEVQVGDGQALQVVCFGNVYIAPANSTVFQYAGRDTLVWNSSPDFLGRELLTDQKDPLPLGVEVIQAWRGRIYVGMYMPRENQTAVWFSDPFGPHLFNLGGSFFMVPGHVNMLAPTKDALIVGTAERIFAYNTESITELAPYGVTPGQHWAHDDDGRILFWSTRGVCAALPFTNLTERSVSVAPGLRAGGTIVRRGWQKRYLVALQQGGSAFNDF